MVKFAAGSKVIKNDFMLVFIHGIGGAKWFSENSEVI